MPSTDAGHVTEHEEGGETFRQLDLTRAVMNSLGEGVYALDLEGHLTFMNPAAERMLGWTEDELLGKSMHDAIHFQRADGTRVPFSECALLDVVRSNNIYRNEDDAYTRKDGTIITVSYTSAPVVTDGRVVGAVVAFRDITQRKQVERQLEDQSNLTRAITDNAASCLFMMDRKGHPTFMNPAAEKVTGYVLEEIKDRPLHDAVHYKRPDGSPYPMSECPIDNASAELTQVREQEEIFVRKDGSLFPVAFSVAPLERNGETVGAVLEFRDITELKRAEVELREQKETVETVNHIGSLLAAELDTHKIVQAVTDAATELTGAHFGAFFYNVLDEHGASYMLYTLSGVPRSAFEHFPMPRATDLFGPTFRGEGVIRIDDVSKDPRYGKNSPYYGMPAGHLPVTSYLAVPVLSRTSEVLGGLFFGDPKQAVFTKRHERILVGLAAQAAVAVDNARLYEAAQRERVKAEASEQHYRFLAEATPQQIWTARPDGTLDYANQRMLDYFGDDGEEMRSSNWQKSVHPDDLPGCLESWARSLATGETFEFEYRIKRASDDSYRWYLGRAIPLRDDDGQVVKWFGTNTDIHDRKRSEEALRFLAQASEVLSASLNYKTTLVSVARLAVPELADWCGVDILKEDGRLQRLAVEHVNPEKVELARELDRRYTPDLNDPEGLAKVLRTGEAELYSDIPDELLAAVARDDEHLRILRELGLRSGIIVPLMAAGRIFGAITLITAESGRRYTGADLQVAEDLARRASTAVDNARLFQEAHEANRLKNESLEALQESELRYRALTEAMPQLVWAADNKGSHFYFNRRWYEYTGLAEEESMGFGFTNALHPEDKDRALTMWERAWRSGEGYDIEYRFYSRPEEQYRWFLGRAMPVRDEAGQIRQWVGTCTDIEDQKQMEATLARLNAERERMLEEVSTPLVPVWQDVLALPIIGSLDTVRMERAMHAALAEVSRTGARACIIDITGARIIDSHAVANLSNLVSALALVGAEAIVTGIGAHAAQSLVGLGLDLHGICTYRTLAQALNALVKSGKFSNNRNR